MQMRHVQTHTDSWDMSEVSKGRQARQAGSSSESL